MNRSVLLSPLLLLTACVSIDDFEPLELDERFSAVVLHGPFSGDATLQATDSQGASYDGVVPVGLAGTDWALGDGADGFWLVGRLGTDVVRRYEWPETGAPALEFSTGPQSNPQVALECGDVVFVSRYGVSPNGGGGDVAVYSPDGTPLGAVDLSEFIEGSDGTPEPSTMVELDGVLYVGLQRFDRNSGWVADPVGKVVSIECESQEVLESWDTRSNVSVFLADGAVHARGEGGVQRLNGGVFQDVLLDSEVGPDPVIGLAAGPDGWVLATENEVSGANTLWCVQPGETPTELELAETRAWAFAVDPVGNAWVSFRDHWVTGAVETGGVGIYDTDSCEKLHQITLSSDPFDIAFTGLP